MSTGLLVSIVVGVLVVGGGAYVVMNPEIVTNLSGGTEAESEIENDDGESASVGSTFAELIALGQSVVCTFSHDDGAGNHTAGTVYMTSGGTQIRGDFTVSSPVAGEAHFIRADGYNYLWGPMMPQGIKTRVTNEAEFSTGGEGGIDEGTPFSCQAWNVDAANFSLPAGVEFMDVSSTIPAGLDTYIDAGAAGTGAAVPGAAVDVSAGAGVTGNAGISAGSSGGSSGSAGVSGSTSGSAGANVAQCAACEQLPIGAKEQCLAALAC